MRAKMLCRSVKVGVTAGGKLFACGFASIALRIDDVVRNVHIGNVKTGTQIVRAKFIFANKFCTQVESKAVVFFFQASRAGG